MSTCKMHCDNCGITRSFYVVSKNKIRILWQCEKCGKIVEQSAV